MNAQAVFYVKVEIAIAAGKRFHHHLHITLKNPTLGFGTQLIWQISHMSHCLYIIYVTHITQSILKISR